MRICVRHVVYAKVIWADQCLVHKVISVPFRGIEAYWDRMSWRDGSSEQWSLSFRHKDKDAPVLSNGVWHSSAQGRDADAVCVVRVWHLAHFSHHHRDPQVLCASADKALRSDWRRVCCDRWAPNGLESSAVSAAAKCFATLCAYQWCWMMWISNWLHVQLRAGMLDRWVHRIVTAIVKATTWIDVLQVAVSKKFTAVEHDVSIANCLTAHWLQIL